MPGVELTCEQESVVQQCYEIAAQLVNLKQVKKDSHKYENEYDKAGCWIYSAICFCIEKNVTEYSEEMAKGLLIGIAAALISGKLPSREVLEKSAAAWYCGAMLQSPDLIIYPYCPSTHTRARSFSAS